MRGNTCGFLADVLPALAGLPPSPRGGCKEGNCICGDFWELLPVTFGHRCFHGLLGPLFAMITETGSTQALPALGPLAVQFR